MPQNKSGSSSKNSNRDSKNRDGKNNNDAKAKTAAGAETISIAVGLDLGTWNARVSTFNKAEESLNGPSNHSTSGSSNAKVGPALIHNHDGARATRAAITIQPKPFDDSDPDYVPPPPGPPKGIVGILKDADEAKEDREHTADYLKGVVLQLACNAAHVPFGQLGVVASIPALATGMAAADDQHNADEDLRQYIAKLRSILDKNLIGCLLEPVAVCLAYSYALPKSQCKHVLVVDLGASGLKVSLLQQLHFGANKEGDGSNTNGNGSSNGGSNNATNGDANSTSTSTNNNVTTSNNGSSSAPAMWSLRYHATNTSVSGPLLIECLGKHVAQQFETKCRFPRGEVWSSKKARRKLQRTGESALTTLLQRSATTTTIHIDGLYEGMDCQVSVSKPRWEMLSSSLANQVKATIQKTLQEVLSSTADNAHQCDRIDQIWLSGPLHAWIQPLIKSACPKDTEIVGFSSTIDPSEAVALGTAIHAQALLDNDKANNSSDDTFSTAIPVSPVAIDIVQSAQAEFNAASRLIDIGTPLPALATYRPTTVLQEEEKKSDASGAAPPLVVWQTSPTQKKLATLNVAACTGSSLVQLHLSDKGQLSIRMGGDSVVIG